MDSRNFVKLFFVVISLLIFGGCQRIGNQTPTGGAPQTLRDVPTLRLNFRFETDVPAPTINQPVQTEERNAAVQTDFDQNRPQDVLDKTLTAPDQQRVLAVYHSSGDLPSEFRLDMYSTDGKLIRKITYDKMAVHFADTIVWSPDSGSVAFVAMTRGGGNPASVTPTPEEIQPNSNSETAADSAAAENTNADPNVGAENANVAAQQTPIAEAPKAVLTFSTEQIYICTRDGADIKPITQNEGLIYFYFGWSPDSSALAALAATSQDWYTLTRQADAKGEQFSPQGRPRVIEKNGRERRLDDNPTAVRPVWSPDSAKVAAAFDKQVRIYDAIGNQPTQAAIPLRNPLLISSKTFDDDLQRQEQMGENASAPANTIQETATLPDENSLVSFNPIISLEWTADEMLYLQTGYIKQMKNETDSARSYLRWHRLIFSPQVGAL